MKRVLGLLMIFAMVGGVVSATASTKDTGDRSYETSFVETYEVVPNIQIFEPGSIRVLISWVAPELTFEQRARISDNAKYYALRSPCEVPITVTNNSRASSFANGFTGDITVRADTIVRSGFQGENITVNLVEGGKAIRINKDTVFSAFKLTFANLADIYMKDYTLDKIITADKTAEHIKTIMTTDVRFTIAAAPK